MKLRGLLLLIIGTVFIAAITHAQQPNILMIVVDDMNDWVGCVGGHPDVQTPCIDRLAARGMLFANAHCAAPVCNPSRVATLTGRRPGSTGIYDNSVRWHEAMPDVTSIPQHFKTNARYGRQTEKEKGREMNRNSAEKSMIQSLLAIATLCTLGSNTLSAETRPNILFCISDDQSYAHTGAGGDPVVQTPAFDRIAREGLRFTHAFCDAPTCGPSRSAILTGQHIWRLEEAGNIHSTLPAKFSTNGWSVDEKPQS